MNDRPNLALLISSIILRPFLHPSPLPPPPRRQRRRQTLAMAIPTTKRLPNQRVCSFLPMPVTSRSFWMRYSSRYVRRRTMKGLITTLDDKGPDHDDSGTAANKLVFVLHPSVVTLLSLRYDNDNNNNGGEGEETVVATQTDKKLMMMTATTAPS
mmetsp:Transcript_23240/g.28478  ORF Transcript_23240/g.28478 Transcript_23240/m.28478 type:complete len:155 (-) Transcript_23240:191-655(-)